jgi:hypothetical protein
MREFLDDLNLASFSCVYFPTAILTFPSELDPVTVGLVYPALHAMTKEFTLDERECLGLVVVDMRRPANRPIQCFAINILARRLLKVD